jgi:hypothetical protein
MSLERVREPFHPPNPWCYIYRPARRERFDYFWKFGCADCTQGATSKPSFEPFVAGITCARRRFPSGINEGRAKPLPSRFANVAQHTRVARQEFRPPVRKVQYRLAEQTWQFSDVIPVR